MKENSVCKIWDSLNRSERYAFLSAMIVGFLTHSFILYNKLSYLDDNTYYFSLGGTWPLGRWGLGVIEEVQKWLGLQTYSMPFINGILTIFFIAVMAVLLVRMLCIKNGLYAVLIGAYMVVFPAVASTFAYMFTAPYYFFGAMLMATAVYLVRRTKYGIIPASLMIAFGMGIYQANIGIATAFFVIVLLCDARKQTFLKNITTAVRCFIGLLTGIVLYFLLNKFFMFVTETELSDYQGINGMTSLSLDGIVSGIVRAYKLWPQLIRWEIVGISNSGLIRLMYAVCLVLFVLFALLYLYQIYKKKDIWNTLYTGVLIVLVPLSIGVIYVMTASSDANLHTLMVYNLFFIPVYPLILLENIEEAAEKKLPVWCHKSAVMTIVIMTLFYIGLDNCAYLKANYQQENAIAYSTELISRIKSVENYSDELPVLILGNVDGQDSSIAYEHEFDEIQIQGYHTNMYKFIAYYANPRFWELHCGYKIYPPADPEKIYESEYVKQMPCYPKDGSIQVVEDTVVVKFSNSY